MAGVNSDVVAFGTVQAGRIQFFDRRAFDQAIRRFRDDTAVQVEVTARRATRSVQQNRWYFGVILHTLSDHTGYTPDELHDVLKMKFLPKRLAICDGNGEVKGEYVLGGSTRQMSTTDFATYCEDIRRWAAEDLDVYIPEPSEHGYGAGV